MFNFSDNYKLRQYYLQEPQVPTQSMIKKKMSSNLTSIFFKSLNSKQKVLVGLEPSLKGGGSNWYVSPKEILVKSRAVLQPLDHEFLTKLNHSGIDHLASQILIDRYNYLKKEKTNMLRDSDLVWQKTIETVSQEYLNKKVQLQTKKNTEYIKQAFYSFSVMYQTNLNNIEKIFHDGLLKEIKRMQEESRHRMKKHYDALRKSQEILITYEVTAKIKKEKERLKAEFITQLETCRTEMTSRLRDLNIDKHVAVEKLRALLEYQKLACQMYVCLKEKEECSKEMEESKQKHKKNVKYLTEATALLNLDIRLAEHKEKKRQEINSIWLRKVSLVVKNFQMFVSYCLNMLPDHAEFFINMEKLMLLQVNEALENPSAESIIAVGVDQFNTTVPQPKPFYLFCDRGNKSCSDSAEVKQNLCPKHSGTSSTSELPVIIINKRCLYAACDNFEQFSNKIEKLINGDCGDDADIKDDVYENFVPVKYGSSEQLSETKLESSLLQILQQEMSNINKVPLPGCEFCDIPHCICTTVDNAKITTKISKDSIEQDVPSVPPQSRNNTASPFANIRRLQHEREPKAEKYIRYTEPKTCGCAKSSKKHLGEHLPAYMRNMSKFDALELPNYETCPVTTLKKLVEHARGGEKTPSIVKISSKTKDVSSQCTDEEYNLLCTCFSHNNIDSFKPARGHHFSFEKSSPSYTIATSSSFAVDRAHSLRKLIQDAPELKEIFNKKI